jgi:hypothetical protein
MKKSLSYFIVLLSLSLWSSVSSAQEWCCHWGSPPTFNSGSMTVITSGTPVSVGNGGPATSATFIAERRAEARKQCNDAAALAKSACNRAAVKTLDSDQLGCAALGASAGVFGILQVVQLQQVLVPLLVLLSVDLV